MESPNDVIQYCTLCCEQSGTHSWAAKYSLLSLLFVLLCTFIKQFLIHFHEQFQGIVN